MRVDVGVSSNQKIVSIYFPTSSNLPGTNFPQEKYHGKSSYRYPPHLSQFRRRPREKPPGLIALLNLRLADSADIHSQVKWAHWNVKGKDFYPLHLLFDAIATHLEDHIDTIAERIAALGGVANGTVRESAAKSSIAEADL